MNYDPFVAIGAVLAIAYLYYLVASELSAQSDAISQLTVDLYELRNDHDELEEEFVALSSEQKAMRARLTRENIEWPELTEGTAS